LQIDVQWIAVNKQAAFKFVQVSFFLQLSSFVVKTTMLHPLTGIKYFTKISPSFLAEQKHDAGNFTTWVEMSRIPQGLCPRS
jgi:hypothetical protein